MRFCEQIRAFVGHYFWLPCVICGRYYGGHERHGDLYLGGGTGVSTCWDCREEGRRLSQGGIEADRRIGRIHESSSL